MTFLFARWDMWSFPGEKMRDYIVYCMIQQYIHMFHWKCIWGPVKICGSLKFRGSPIVLHGNGLVIIYIAWMLVLVSCFVSPLSFCMVWGNQTFWIITRRLISWTYTLNHFEVASYIYICISSHIHKCKGTLISFPFKQSPSGNSEGCHAKTSEEAMECALRKTCHPNLKKITPEN